MFDLSGVPKARPPEGKVRPLSSLVHRPKERALIAEETTRFLGVLEGRLTLGIRNRLDPEVLVGRERLEREGRKCDIAGSFRGEQIAVMHSAKPRHKRNPEPAEVLKLFDLGRIARVHEAIVTIQYSSLGIPSNDYLPPSVCLRSAPRKWPRRSRFPLRPCLHIESVFRRCSTRTRSRS